MGRCQWDISPCFLLHFWQRYVAAKLCCFWWGTKYSRTGVVRGSLTNLLTLPLVIALHGIRAEKTFSRLDVLNAADSYQADERKKPAHGRHI